MDPGTIDAIRWATKRNWRDMGCDCEPAIDIAVLEGGRQVRVTTTHQSWCVTQREEA